MIVNKYDYKSITKPEGRKLPSVTKVLSATADKSFLIEWRERIGDKEADRILKEATEVIGTKLHSYIEWKLGVGEKPKLLPLVQMMAEAIIRKGVNKLNEIWGIEVSLYIHDLYSGRADCIGVYNGKPAIIDFKNSQKAKKREWLDDYFCQGVAYAEAHNQEFSTEIETVVLMIATKDGQYQEFSITGEEYKKYKKMWFDRLYRYYEINGI